MRKLTRREFVLIGVLVAAGLIVFSSLDTGIGGGGSKARQDEAGPLGSPPVIYMHAIYAKAEEYGDSNRDLFMYGTPPRPKGQPLQAVRRPPPTRKPELPKRPVVSPPPRPQPTKKIMQPPEIHFKYVGYLGPKDGKIAVFADGDDMILARAGDIVKDEFRVLEFRYESILMGYTDGRFRDKTTEVTQER